MGHISVALVAVFFYELGQRVGGGRRMRRSAFEGNRIRLVQNKTQKELRLPVSDALAR